MRRRILRSYGPVLSGLTLLGASLAGPPGEALAHEIPANVTILAYVKPEGDRLRLLVRAPLEAMRDVEFPLRGPGYLVIEEAEPFLREAARLWLAGYVEIYEGGARLAREEIVAVRASLPTDRNFGSYEDALAHVTGPPLPPATELFWTQALLDVVFEYPIASADSDFSLLPQWAHLGIRTTTILRFNMPDGRERVFQYVDFPGLVRLDPRWHQAARTFLHLGFLHIMEGIDHILFVLCLVIPFRRLRPLVAIITAFTVAHSITLAASALGFGPDALWFPPLVETLIALSIVYMALENIVGGIGLQRRWLIAFGFGLVHGFGFSWQLRESLQFAGSHLATSLLAFNVGVELGQILVVVLAIPVLGLLFRYVMAERVGIIILSALVGHTAWHWMTELAAQLAEYPIEAPAFDLAFLASAMRWLMLILMAVGAAWLLHTLIGRLVPEARSAPADGEPAATAPRSKA